jgi:hypothetical protein
MRFQKSGMTWYSSNTTPRSDKEVAHALLLRGLLPTDDAEVCTLCGKSSANHHFDHCASLKGSRTARHNAVQYAIVSALRTVKGVLVTTEPPIEGSADLRNDIRVVALEHASINDIDVDLTVRSLSAVRHQPGGVKDPETLKEAKALAEAVVRTWRVEKQSKIDRLESYTRHHLFHILPISSGGFCDMEAIRLLDGWKKAIPPWSYTHMSHMISIKLVQARALGSRQQIS